MGNIEHWSGESLHAHLLYDGDVPDAWPAWHALSHDWQLKWEEIAVRLNDRGAVKDLDDLRATLRNILDAGFNYPEEYRESIEDALEPTSGGR